MDVRHRRYRARARFGLILLLSVIGYWAATAVHGAEGDWVLGRWELSYDPEQRDKDWLEFRANGDVYNIWPDGTRVAGIYVVTAEGVKAVLTHQGQDVILTFHGDEARTSLRIVTSASGKESVYTKVAD